MKFEFTGDELRVIEAALIDRPYKEVAGVMASLMRQYVAHQAAQEKQTAAVEALKGAALKAPNKPADAPAA